MTIGNLDGYKPYRDDPTSAATPWATFSRANQTFACAAIADRLQNDASGTPHVYELWNEPDGIAGLPAQLLVPMVLAVIEKARTKGSECYDPGAKFSVGAAVN